MEAGVVTPEQVDAALVRQRSTGLRIGETLVEMGAATEEDIGWALSRQLEIPFVDLHPEAMDRDLIASFPEGVLRRLDAVPLVSEDTALAVALADPTDADIVDELARAAGRSLKLAVATPSSIRRMLGTVLGERRDPRALRPASHPDSNFDVQWDRSGASFLLFHLGQAHRAGASQIHFLPKPGSLEVHHRVGDRLVRTATEPPAALYYLLARVDALGGPGLDDRVLHAEGRVRCAIGGRTEELAVSLLQHPEGVAVTFELRLEPRQPPTLEALGFEPVDLARLRAALEAPAGLGLVTGPPRCGGSTTLACVLSEAGIAGRRCLVFGDAAPHMPAELLVTGADGAREWQRAAVAQCADVVVLDGVLPGDAVEDALAPAAAGRLLLVRADWTDTFALLEHLARRHGNRAALAERLRFVVQQRLLRREATAPPDAGLWGDRLAALETLVADEPLLEALRAGEPAARLRAEAQAGGFQPLAGHVGAMTASGAVSAAEAARALS